MPDVCCLLLGSDSLRKVPMCVGLDRASNDFIIETSIVTQKNQDKIRIEDFEDQQGKEKCWHT